MNTILFDDPEIRVSLLPLTFTRPVAALRCGIFTIKEKWDRRLSVSSSYYTEKYLSEKYPAQTADDNLAINGALLPSSGLAEKIMALKTGEGLAMGKTLLAARVKNNQLDQLIASSFADADALKLAETEAQLIRQTWDVFRFNGAEIKQDMEIVAPRAPSQKLRDSHTAIYGEENIYVEPGASVKAAVLNAENGPIYLGKNSEVQEGALIRGPFALCEGSVVSMGAKIRGDSTVGPYSKVGGEVANSVFTGYSNKAHDGYIGNSVVGEWCNLGADTNTSNLKNNYMPVKVWSHKKDEFINSGLQFCGLVMGDHSKSGINTMFNTGTVVGVSANIYGAGYPRAFIPSFAWGGASGLATFALNKAFEVAEVVMARRKKSFGEEEKKILTHIFEATRKYRVWEKKS